MNFFSIEESKSGGRGRLTSTKDVWIYFVIAVPLTAIVLGVWWWWQRREAQKAKKQNEGGTKKDV